MAQFLLGGRARENGIDLFHRVVLILVDQGGMIDDFRLPSSLGHEHNAPGTDHLANANAKRFILPPVDSIPMARQQLLLSLADGPAFRKYPITVLPGQPFHLFPKGRIIDSPQDMQMNVVPPLPDVGKNRDDGVHLFSGTTRPRQTKP